METPYNVISGKKYRGTNKFFLYLQSQERLSEGEIPDPRWATFKQIQDAGWKVKKGAKGFVVELWKPYDFESKEKSAGKNTLRITCHMKNTALLQEIIMFLMVGI